MLGECVKGKTNCLRNQTKCQLSCYGNRDSERHNKILLCMCKYSFLVFNRLTLHLFVSKISNISYSIIMIWSRLSFESVSMPPVSKSSFNNLSPLAVVLFVDETYNLQTLQARKTRRSLRLSQ